MESEKCKIKIGCLLLAICYVLSAICYAQSAKELKKEREKIAKQGIKTMTETGYDIFEEKSGESVKVRHCKSISKYDKNGNMIEEVLYDPDGTIVSKDIPKYDNNGNMIEKDHYDTNGELSDKYIYKYDDNGNIIEIDGCIPSGRCYIKSLYKYDSNGNISDDVSYAFGKLQDKSIHKYDDKGNEIEFDVELLQYDDNCMLPRKIVYKYKYDDKEYIIEQTTYYIRDGKEIPQSQTVYEYTFYDKSKEQKEKRKDTNK